VRCRGQQRVVRANNLFEVGLIRGEPISLSMDRREVRAAGTLDHAPIVEPGLVRRNSGLPSPPDECEIGGRTAARNDECQDGPHKRRTGQRTGRVAKRRPCCIPV